MSVRLRLRRMGKTHRPFYRICAIEKGRARDAKYIESIGYYDPFIEDNAKKFHLDKERAEYWISVGATPSQTVLTFLRQEEVEGLGTVKKVKTRRKLGSPEKKNESEEGPGARPLSAEKRAARDERLERKRKRKQKAQNKQAPPEPKEEAPAAEAEEGAEAEVVEAQDEAAEAQVEEAPAEEAAAEEAPAEEAAEEAPAEEAAAEEAPAEEAEESSE